MSDLSAEVKGQVAAVESSLADALKFFKQLDNFDYDQVTANLLPIDRARYDLTVLYAVNSLFWMLKRSYGEDPQEHGVKGEIDRIKEQMMRLKQISDKVKMPRVDKSAASRIVKHELGPNQNQRKRKRAKTIDEENWDNEMKEVEQS